MAETPRACPACGGSGLIRSGHACGRQRWRWEGCGQQFTRTTPRGKPAAMKREVRRFRFAKRRGRALLHGPVAERDRQAAGRVGAERAALGMRPRARALPQAGAGRARG